MSEPLYRTFVALGDSFTEGVGDVDDAYPNGLRGWADLVAEQLAKNAPDVRYANLAIRGRMLGPILDDQLAPALDMEPDLVAIYAGANDIIRPRVDIDALVARYDDAIGKLAATGATVVLFTARDTAGAVVFDQLRGRFAIYNELVREVAERHKCVVIDFWRFNEYNDFRMWDWDRIHMSTAGHQNMAIRVLDELGVPHDLEAVDLGPAPKLDAGQQRKADRIWFRDFAVPWIARRVRGISSGDSVSPKYPTPVRVPERGAPID